MGDCYGVVLRVKVNPKKSTVSNLQKLMRQWMKDEAKGTDARQGVNWSLQTYRKAGIRPDTLAGICKILLAFQQGNARHFVGKEGFDLFRSGFNASYGWYSVMVEAFEKMAWALEEGSYLDIWYGSNSHDVYKIEINDEGEAEVWENHRHGS